MTHRLMTGPTAPALALTPLAYWSHGETSGSTAVDSSGNGHNGSWDDGVVSLLRVALGVLLAAWVVAILAHYNAGTSAFTPKIVLF